MTLCAALMLVLADCWCTGTGCTQGLMSALLVVYSMQQDMFSIVAVTEQQLSVVMAYV